jgi:putative ABC transport system permease protein
MNNLYVRLAKNNLKNNKSLYVPYMVAGMITVLMFYIMMFINNSAGLEKMRGAFYITTIMSFGVIVVGVFSYIYIFYTNSFISKRRKKEMGIYNILGMEKRHIAKVLAIETVFTAFVSIVGGIVAGILFSKLALMLIYRILGIQVTIEFSVPPSAVKNTVLVFGILYMMTLFYNLMQMKLANPVELLRGSSVGEKEPKTKWLMAILGVVCLGAGYAIAITTEQPMKVISLFFVAVLLVIAGTYMLFTAGSIAVLKLLRKTHGFYYKKKHFIAVSTMMYRMKQNAAGLASICILSTMVMVMVSTTVCMFVGFDDEINILYPYEINVQTGYSEVKENVSEQSSDIIQFIEDTGTNVTDSESYSYLNFAMTLEKDSLTIGQKPTNASLYFLTRDNFLRMDHTLTEADVPKVEAGKILIYREKRFQSTKTLRGDQIQILGETFTVQQNGYCKNRCNGGAISFMDGVYYIVVDHMQTLQKLQKLAIAEANTENVSAYAYENVLGINITGTETEKIACSGNVENYSSGEKYGVVWRRVRGSKPEGAAGTVRRVFLPWDFPWHRLSGSDSDDYFLQTGIGGVRGQRAIPDHGTGGHEQCRGEVSDRDADPHGVLSADRGGSTACRGGISTDPQSAFPVDYGQRAVVCLVSRYNGTCICGYLLCGIPDHFKNLLPHCGQSGALNYLWKVTGSITENTFLSPCRSTVILPEWFVTIECAMDRPSPK